MPVPLARPVSLTSDDHARLESLVRAHSTPQSLSFRCQVLLRIAAPDQPSNVQVATELACARHTVGRWRQRYLAHGLTGLQDGVDMQSVSKVAISMLNNFNGLQR